MTSASATNEALKIAESVSFNPLEAAQDLLSEDLDAVNRLILERLHSDVVLVNQVGHHIIQSGGKRLRPLMVLLAARAFGYGGTHHRDMAAIVEFIHTATLLHDDVVDESRQRRGRPTANLLWDNKSSVLVGDYLFARAFQLMVEPGDLRVLEILSNAAATIAEGEVLQLTAAGNLATDEDIYLQVVRGKTAALFSAATEAGAVLSGAEAAQVRALFDYGDALGIAFQIADDLLDYLGTEATGKNTGDDFAEGKLTLPVIRAVAAAAGEEERAFWRRTIESRRQEPGDLARARALMEAHGTLESTRATALDWSDRARAALAALPDHPLRDMLDHLADYVVARLR